MVKQHASIVAGNERNIRDNLKTHFCGQPQTAYKYNYGFTFDFFLFKSRACDDSGTHSSNQVAVTFYGFT